MVQIIEEDVPFAGIGGAVGQGLSQGINALLKNKLESTKQERQLRQLQNLLGKKPPSVDPEVEEEEMVSTGRSSPTEEEIQMATLLNPNLGRVLQSQSKAAQQKQTEQDKRAFQRSTKYLEGIEKEEGALANKELALAQMRNALESGNLKSLGNIAAEYTGLDLLRNAEGAVLNSALKEFIIGDLQKITGQKNQWIEKQMKSALINPAYPQQANEVILEGLEYLNQIKKLEIDKAKEIEEKFLAKGKEPPRNLSTVVKKAIKPEIEDLKKVYQRKLKSLQKAPTEEEVIIINPKTKERMILKEGQWQPL